MNLPVSRERIEPTLAGCTVGVAIDLASIASTIAQSTTGTTALYIMVDW